MARLPFSLQMQLPADLFSGTVQINLDGASVVAPPAAKRPCEEMVELMGLALGGQVAEENNLIDCPVEEVVADQIDLTSILVRSKVIGGPRLQSAKELAGGEAGKIEVAAAGH